MRPLLFLFTLLYMSQISSLTAQKQLLTPELLWKVGRVSLDCVSPDGSMAVYGVRKYSAEHNNSKRVLYLINLKTKESRPLTDASSSASDAAFNPAGDRIGFIQGGKLHEVSLQTNTTSQVTEFELNGFKYAPDGKHILFIQDVKFDQTPTERYPDLPSATGRISDQLFYRHWKSWHDYQYSNVFYIRYADGKAVGSPVNIMNEPYDSPLRPMGGMEQISWSPDSKFIVYTCRKLKGTAETRSTNSDLYLYDLATSKTLNVTEGMVGYDLDPVFSPDGRYLAWTSMETAGYEADRPRLMLLDTRTNDRTELSAGWNSEVVHPQWAEDGSGLYFLSATDFTYQIFRVNLSDRKIRQITTGQHDYNNFMTAGDQIVATRVSMTYPAELYLVDPTSGKAEQITSATADPWASVAQSKVERRNVKTTDGKNMNVWVVLPPDYEAGKQYPALLYCQGGPQSALSQFFSYRWNLQLMAAQGYVIIAPCRRGMPGGPEGQAWNAAISGDWGGQPMQDLLAATDALVKEPFIDASRVGAVGASFGGYSVFWLAGNHNKRFKTFISHCGMFNTTSWYGTTEELWFANYDLGGPYWEHPTDASWTKFSPHLYVQNWDTPILVMHNELDFRVPFSEGMQAFQAAQLQGIPSRLVSFPDEGHWMSTPQNSLMWQREFFRWLETYLK
ncbi:MAG: S9 family peptidase [Bacteroidetes bacterium]|nr:MAG: S9 family peptidase [Bacteroidota bacterium]